MSLEIKALAESQKISPVKDDNLRYEFLLSAIQELNKDLVKLANDIKVLKSALTSDLLRSSAFSENELPHPHPKVSPTINLYFGNQKL